MAQLTRRELLKKDPLRIEKIMLGKDEFVHIREMTAHDRDQFENSLYIDVKKEEEGEGKFSTVKSLEDYRGKLAVCVVCDAEGKLLLNPEDYKFISENMSASKMELIVTAAQRLNAISEKDREELIKNSVGAQSAASISDSAKS